ncbi:MAG TPA: ABC transporter ATP-binding protein [Candidatus Methanofastidiosa archaeon]|nr:ABC transporter ATP-binding protein [Candidatus Methanofastidiosa archaeon]
MKDKEILMEVKDLVTRFYTEDGVVKALEGVSFTLYKGETLALVGETGCGKSVTALSILRLLPISGKTLKGEVLFYDEETKARLKYNEKGPIPVLTLEPQDMLKLRGFGMSLITQDPMTSLNPVYTVGDQLMEVIKLHKKLPDNETKKLALKLLEDVELTPPEEIFNKYPHQLSGGQRQRIVISISLAAEPALIFADEPTTALDVTIQARVLELMQELKEEFQTSLILITHNLGIVAETSDRVGVMYAGRVVEVADKYTLFNRPLHPYTQGLIAAVPVITEKREELSYIPGTVPNLIHPPTGCRFHPRCPYATDICKEKIPELKAVETDDHFVECWNIDAVIKDLAEKGGAC